MSVKNMFSFALPRYLYQTGSNFFRLQPQPFFCVQTRYNLLQPPRRRKMATVKDSIPHVVRTAADQRNTDLHDASIGRIEQINSRIRLLRLYLAPHTPSLRHLPGQYIDLTIPGVETVGGFTITSPPQTALRIPAPTPSTTTPASAATFDDPYIELAIQNSPGNPPAAYLWRTPEDIMNAPVQLRVGGNFTYPPLTVGKSEFEQVNSVVFIAGGVGINPIMSMISAMDIQGAARLGGIPKRVRVLYTSRREPGDNENPSGGEVLFEKRLRAIAQKWSKQDQVDLKVSFYETSNPRQSDDGARDADAFNTQFRRIKHDDLFEALGAEDERQNTLVYICGLPSMTDEYVELLSKAPGMEAKRVFCEKWW